jgi:hypothetical protein
MSIDARLYLSANVMPEQVVKFLNKPDCKIEQTTIPGYCLIVGFEKGRHINFHFQADTPVGQFVLLSMGSDSFSIDLLEKIGKKFGGLMEENDYNGDMRFVYP